MHPLVQRCLLSAKQQELDQLDQLHLLIELVAVVGELIHQLQRERGLSNWLIYMPNAACSQLLRQQQQTVDSALQAVEQQLQQWLRDGRMAPTRLQTALGYALHAQQDLPTIREHVWAAHALNHDSADTTEFYSQRIRYWLDVVIEVAGVSVAPRLSTGILQLIYLLQAKEFAGQERAHGMIAFSGKGEGQALVEQFVVLQLAQQDNLQALWPLLSAPCQHAFAAPLQQPQQDQFSQLRQLMKGLCDHNQASPALADMWFDAASARIDLMHALMAELMRDLSEQLRHSRHYCQQQRQSLKHHQVALELPQHGALLEPDTIDASAHSLFSQLREQAHYIANIENQLSQSKAAVHELKLVQRAKLLLIERYRIGESQAHHQLQKLAMDQQVPLSTIASTLISQLG